MICNHLGFADQLAGSSGGKRYVARTNTVDARQVARATQWVLSCHFFLPPNTLTPIIYASRAGK
jgi:hypothetical protein